MTILPLGRFYISKCTSLFRLLIAKHVSKVSLFSFACLHYALLVFYQIAERQLFSV